MSRFAHIDARPKPIGGLKRLMQYLETTDQEAADELRALLDDPAQDAGGLAVQINDEIKEDGLTDRSGHPLKITRSMVQKWRKPEAA